MMRRLPAGMELEIQDGTVRSPVGFGTLPYGTSPKYKWMRIRSFPPEDDLLPLTGPLPLHLLPFQLITALNPSNMDFIQQTREPVKR